LLQGLHLYIQNSPLLKHNMSGWGAGICNHVSAGGSFEYKGEGPGAIRSCSICGLIEECYNPDIKTPHYIQWRKIQNEKGNEAGIYKRVVQRKGEKG
jgi:hypothetical protein